MQKLKLEIPTISSLGLILLVLGSLGCCITDAVPFVDTRPRVSRYRAEINEPIRRIVILPMAGSLREEAMSDAITEELAQKLRARGLFEVVVLTRTEIGYPADVVKNGRYDEQLLVDMYRAHGADGVLFSRLNRYTAFSPMSADLIVHLVDTRDSAVVASIDGTWDLKDDGDRQRFCEFASMGSARGVSPALAQQSPMLLAGFIAQEIAAAF